jgi:hypothetical protein
MPRLLLVVGFFSLASVASAQNRFATGAVNDYGGCGSDLSWCIKQGNDFATWYTLAGFGAFSRWTDGNVFGSDFRNGANSDFEPNGGSDRPNVYFYSGHGTCQNPPNASSPDFISACGNFGDPDRTSIGDSSRWGDRNLNFLFLDASCPMDLVSIRQVWFGAFDGLHMATGHSGSSTMDTLDSPDRTGPFAAYTVTGGTLLGGLIPELSVGDAWIATATTDIQPGCCAVALAAGNNRADAIDRRENERVRENRNDPVPNWFAWKWACR